MFFLKRFFSGRKTCLSKREYKILIHESFGDSIKTIARKRKIANLPVEFERG